MNTTARSGPRFGIAARPAIVKEILDRASAICFWGMSMPNPVNPARNILLAMLVQVAAFAAAAAQTRPVEIVPITPPHQPFTVAFSPDGARILSGGFDNTMKLWDVATGRLLRTFQGHSSVVRS